MEGRCESERASGGKGSASHARRCEPLATEESEGHHDGEGGEPPPQRPSRDRLRQRTAEIPADQKAERGPQRGREPHVTGAPVLQDRQDADRRQQDRERSPLGLVLRHGEQIREQRHHDEPAAQPDEPAERPSQEPHHDRERRLHQLPQTPGGAVARGRRATARRVCMSLWILHARADFQVGAKGRGLVATRRQNMEDGTRDRGDGGEQADGRGTRVIGSLSGLLVALALPIAWFVLHFGGIVHAPLEVALASGAGICGAAFLLSWATEVAQLDIPRALALAVLALLAVLPEYAVDVYFAWRAGQDATYTAFASANMTGANRLLIGVGWAAPVVAFWLKYRQHQVAIPREQAIEVNYLAIATAYSFVIPLKGTLSLIDTFFLFGVFVAYVWSAGGAHHEEPELDGPAKLIADLGTVGRRVVVVGIFALAGTAILTAAEPFAEGLVATGRQFGIEEFLLVQWLAPLASESPEFIVAVLFALRGAVAAGIGTMISSGVNQWTLLVGALPAAFALSRGAFDPMLLDLRQREEIFLTSAQSVFALLVISNFEFSIVEAGMLVGLFVPQFLLTGSSARIGLAIVYLVLSGAMLVGSRSLRASVRQLLPGARHAAKPARQH